MMGRKKPLRYCEYQSGKGREKRLQSSFLYLYLNTKGGELQLII